MSIQNNEGVNVEKAFELWSISQGETIMNARTIFAATERDAVESYTGAPAVLAPNGRCYWSRGYAIGVTASPVLPMGVTR